MSLPSLARKGRGERPSLNRARPCPVARLLSPLPQAGEGAVSRRQTRLVEAVSVCIPHVVPSSRFVPLRSFSLPQARPGSGPQFARILRGRGRVSAPVRFARLIARAREAQTQGAPLLSAPKGISRAGANRERERPRAAAASLLPTYCNWSVEFQVRLQKNFIFFRTNRFLARLYLYLPVRFRKEPEAGFASSPRGRAGFLPCRRGAIHPAPAEGEGSSWPEHMRPRSAAR